MAGAWRMRGVVAVVTAVLATVTTPAWAGPPVPSVPLVGPEAATGLWQPVSGLLPLPEGRDGAYRPHRPARPWKHRRPARPAYRPAESRLLRAVNRQRARAGCRPVSPRGRLTRVARAHSADMARHRRLSHWGSDGSSPGARVRRAGYRPRATAETLTAGQHSPEAAVRAWMHSPAHRRAILTCSFRRAGAGVVRGRGGPWWTLVLMSGR